LIRLDWLRQGWAGKESEQGVGKVALVYHLNEGFEVFLGSQPVAEAAPSPLRKVLFVNGAGAEPVYKHALDFRERIEPGENGCGVLFFTQTTVYFHPKVVGEAGDFSVAAQRLNGRVHDFLI